MISSLAKGALGQSIVISDGQKVFLTRCDFGGYFRISSVVTYRGYQYRDGSKSSSSISSVWFSYTTL